MNPDGPPVVIGVGEEFLHDDGVGPAVIAELRRLAAAGTLPPDTRLVTDFGEPTGLIELWRGARLAIVVDAAAADEPAGLAPGDVLRWEVECPGCPGGGRAHPAPGTGTGIEVRTSPAAGRRPTRQAAATTPRTVAPARGPAATHGLGPGAAIALAEVLDRLPGRLVLYAVVGADFSLGPGLSPRVSAATRAVAQDIAAEVRRQGLSTRVEGDLLSWSGGAAGPRLGT